MNWFELCRDENGIKTEYRRLAKLHHPDIGGDTATMQDINAAYMAALRATYQAYGWTSEKVDSRLDLDLEIVAQAEKIWKACKDIEIEVCGVWLWISGNTKAVKDTLKAFGCSWAPKKALWSWHRPQDGKTWHRRTPLPMQAVRAKYGSSMMAFKEDTQPMAC